MFKNNISNNLTVVSTKRVAVKQFSCQCMVEMGTSPEGRVALLMPCLGKIFFVSVMK